jgi:hypothetical protein
VEFRDFETEQAPFHVSITATQATVDNPIGCTNVFGQYTTVIAATEAGPVQVEIDACLVFPGDCEPSGICETFTAGVGSGVDLSGTYVGLTGGDFITGLTTMTVTQNQNAVSGTFEVRNQLGGVHVGGFTATLSGTRLVGLDIFLDDCPVDADFGVGIVTVEGDRIQLELPVAQGTDCHGHRLTTLRACGPNAAIAGIDFSGPFNGAFHLGSFGFGPQATGTQSGGFGTLTGSFTGERTGTFSATVVPTEGGDECVVARLTDVKLTFDDCPLVPFGNGEITGCVRLDGTSFRLIVERPRLIDGCTGEAMVAFEFRFNRGSCITG